MVSVRVPKVCNCNIIYRIKPTTYGQMLLVSWQNIGELKMCSTSVNNTISPRVLNKKKPDPVTKDKKNSSEPEMTTSQILKDSNNQLFSSYEDNFMLEAVDKIIKKRWRIIGRTTRYGWLAACSYKRTVSPEDAKTLSALGNKIGVEHSGEAIERIENLAQKLHPRDVPTVAIAVLTETHTALMLRQRRGLKSSTKPVKDRFPTIFTISDACTIKRTNLI